MIEVSILIKAINLAWASSKCEIETHPIEYGIILGSADPIKTAISGGILHGPKLDFLECTASDVLQNYAGLQSWNKAALIVDCEKNCVDGSINLGDINVEDPYEFITGVTNSIGVVAKRVSSVRIYYDGRFRVQYIFNRKRGEIEERNMESFLPLFEKREINRNMARKIIDTCFRLSEIRQGASFIIGTPSDVRKLSITSRAGSVQKTIHDLTALEIINYATVDGSIWVDKQGLLHEYGLKFEGPGGRLAIVKSICAKNEKITALVVSQDGEINLVYQNETCRFASQIIPDSLFLADRL
ncbi:MAG: hypothetical protein ACPL3B_05750 [Fervidobacterium sp.]